MRIKTVQNPSLKDDAIVDECMEKLMNEYPGVLQSYMWERVGEDIQVMIIGNIGESTQ